MTTKQAALELIRDLPDDSTLNEIIAELQELRKRDRDERETDRTTLLKWFP